jgi:hypothetical protein
VQSYHARPWHRGAGVKRRLCTLDSSPERWLVAAERVAAAEGSRVWKPNSPPRTVLIRGGRQVSRAPELCLRARPRVRAPFWVYFGLNL